MSSGTLACDWMISLSPLRLFGRRFRRRWAKQAPAALEIVHGICTMINYHNVLSKTYRLSIAIAINLILVLTVLHTF